MTALAIITARGGSRRIPKKNIKFFCGKPIIAYTIEAALNAQCFNEVMVSTDDPEIVRVAEKYGASVPFLRTVGTADNNAVTEDVWMEVLRAYHANGKDFDYFCGLYPCAPFINATRLRETYAMIQQTCRKAVCPVVRFSYPIQRALRIENGVLVFENPNYLTARSQDLQPYYHDAGQFYWYKTSCFYQDHSGDFSGMEPVVLPESEVQDIDTPEDWEIAEMKYRILHALQGMEQC